MPDYELKLADLCEVEIHVSAPIVIGPSSWGIRMVIPVVGGTVEGPKLKGRIRPPGADWLLIRADNCLELDIRTVIETDDDAVIYASYAGVAATTRKQVEEYLSGKLPEGVDLFVTPRFETSDERYQWLTRIQAVGRGTAELEADGIKVTYSWYELTA